MRHLIATRLGIMIARPTFYQHHIDLLEAGLLQCLANQTSKAFEWVVIVDQRIPDDQHDRLVRLVWPANGRVLRYDPIAELRMLPSVSEMIGSPGDDLLMTRVDDDDLFAEDFVERLQIEARSRSVRFPRSIALATGLRIDPGAATYRPYLHRTTPVGISLMSPAAAALSVYSYNHNKLHEKCHEAGGEGVVVETAEPMWAYILRGSSDSAAHRRLARDHLPPDAILADFLRRCHLPKDWLDRIHSLNEGEDDPRPVIHGTALNRLQLKGQYLAALRELRDRPNNDRREALIAAIYAV